MESNKEFLPAIYWKTTPIILHGTVAGMDNRAEVEFERVQEGEDLAQVHGETVKNYAVLDQLVSGAIALLNRVGWPVQGVAAAPGSGTGVGASILSKDPAIREIYSIEYSEKHVTHVMPEVFQYFHAMGEKIRRVVGNINDIQLPDESLDLILEIDSYHDSEDLALSEREAYRVLKPGGAVIAVDRAWADETPESHLDDLLAKEFPAEQKRNTASRRLKVLLAVTSVSMNISAVSGSRHSRKSVLRHLCSSRTIQKIFQGQISFCCACRRLTGL